MTSLLRHNGLTLSLLIANLILLSVLAMELRSGAEVDGIDQPTEGQQAVDRHLLHDIEFGLMPLEHYSEIIERPLFQETRRPPEEASATGGAQQPKQLQPLPFVLTGVVIAPDKRQALLLDVKSKKVSRVQQGEEIGGWRLEKVDPETVVLRRGDTSEEVRLLRKSEATAVVGTKAKQPQERSRH